MKRSSQTGVRGFRGVISGLMACLVAVALLVIPAPAHAAGGGCSGNLVPEGWRFSACSADNGVTVFADGYLDVVGDMRGATSCVIIVKLMDVTTPGVNWNRGQARSGCYVQHLPTVSTPKVPGRKYRTWVDLERTPCCTVTRQVSPTTT